MRFRKLTLLLSVMAGLVAALPAMAQPFPSRPIKIMVGFGPGGGVDSFSRIYGDKVQGILGQPVIVENRPGAFQLPAIQPLMQAKPDGYTLYMGSASSLILSPSVRKDLPYDPAKDFTYIALLAKQQAVIVAPPDFPAKTVDELIAYAKANPGKLNYGSAGVGAANHVLMEFLMQASDIKMQHVPFKTDIEVTQALMSGQIHVAMILSQTGLPLIKDGKLKVLGITGGQRAGFLPDTPCLGENANPKLKAIDAYTFSALLGPKDMPADVVQKLNETFNQVSKMPDVLAQVRGPLASDDPLIWSPEQFRKYVESSLVTWREAGKNIKVE